MVPRARGNVTTPRLMNTLKLLESPKRDKPFCDVQEALGTSPPPAAPWDTGRSWVPTHFSAIYQAGAVP